MLILEVWSLKILSALPLEMGRNRCYLYIVIDTIPHAHSATNMISFVYSKRTLRNVRSGVRSFSANQHYPTTMHNNSVYFQVH